MAEQVKCPICGRRLFDLEESSVGSIAIKCTQCRNVLRVRLEKEPKNNSIKINRMFAEPKGV